MGVRRAVAVVQVVVALHRPERVLVGMFAVVGMRMNMARTIGMDMFVAMLMLMGFALNRGFAFAATASGAHGKSS